MGLERELIGRVRRLDDYDLRRLLILARGILVARGGEDPGDEPSPETGGVTYRQEHVRCGREACTRCPHGPYWYAYWREDGRMRSRYLGKQGPPGASDGRGG